MPCARLLVDLRALVHNYRTVTETTNRTANREHGAVAANVAAVVKANAYGLGVEPVATSLIAAGCRSFYVATVEEGLALRSVIGEPSHEVSIGVLNGCEVGEIETCLRHRLEPVVNSTEQLAAWRGRTDAPLILHVDTGMQRLGVSVAELDALNLDAADLRRVLSHYACADEPESSANAEQEQRVAAVTQRWPGVPLSFGNSAAALSGLTTGDEIRAGIALYGGNPYQSKENPMRSVATLEAKVLQVREVAAGTAIGYGGSFVAPERMRIATVGAGYADGIPRLLSNRGSVAVNGHELPIVGMISMDTTMVDASRAPVAVGDWVEFFGEHIGIDRVAALAQTISYEIFTGIGPRPARHYSDGRD